MKVGDFLIIFRVGEDDSEQEREHVRSAVGNRARSEIHQFAQAKQERRKTVERENVGRSKQRRASRPHAHSRFSLERLPRLQCQSCTRASVERASSKREQRANLAEERLEHCPTLLSCTLSQKSGHEHGG